MSDSENVPWLHGGEDMSSDYDEDTIPAGIGEVGCKVWPMTSALSLSACLLLRGVDGYVMVRVA